MKGMMATVATAAVCLAMCGVVTAGDEATAYTPETGFEALETLVGTWLNEKNADPKQGMVIRMTGAGSVVAVTQFPDSPMEMMSLFHMDGPDRLVHTHYCALQNQPTMVMVPSEAAGVMRFEFESGTNMDVAKDMHTHHTEMHLLDDGKVKVVVEAWSDGKPMPAQEFTMVRAESEVAAAE